MRDYCVMHFKQLTEKGPLSRADGFTTTGHAGKMLRWLLDDVGFSFLLIFCLESQSMPHISPLWSHCCLSSNWFAPVYILVRVLPFSHSWVTVFKINAHIESASKKVVVIATGLVRQA
jgi:hypothetical protein